MYQGSEALRLDVSERVQPLHSPRASFEVVEGAGLDARARRGVTPQFLARVRAFAAVAVVVAVLALARVALFASTVGVLAENTSMRTELKDARSAQDGLQVERSILSNAQRIDRIATQTYGMVKAGSEEQMDASSASAGASATAAEGASATSAEGTSSSAAADYASGDPTAPVAGSAATGTSGASSSEASSDDDSASATAAALASSAQTQGDGTGAGSNAASLEGLS